MATTYKWKRYTMVPPSMSSLSWGSREGDLGLSQSHSPKNNIPAVALKNLSSISMRLGTVSTFKTSWFVLPDSASKKQFSTNMSVLCSEYPYILIPEFASGDAVVGWNIGYSTSGRWETHAVINDVYHKDSSGSNYSNYQSASCPDASKFTKSSSYDVVTSTNRYQYSDGLSYTGKGPGDLSSEGAYWYEYIGEEITPDYTVTLIASPSNGGTVSGGGGYVSGATATITATPAYGYEFVEWQENGMFATNSSSISFTVKKDRTFTAIFKQKLGLMIGIGSKAKKGLELPVGVNMKARKVTSAYIGVNGKARRFL